MDLAQRAVACKGWRWMPGMATVAAETPAVWYPRIGDECKPRYPHLLPDLSDPATLGCLLALVREAYGQPSAFCRYVESDPAFWHINTGHVGATEAAALVAALEAAP